MKSNYEFLGDIIQEVINDSDKKEGIDLSQVPDRVKFSKVEDFFRNAPKPFCNVELTRRIFTSYIQNGILPDVSESDRPNDNLTLYTRDQIIYYFLAQQLKALTKLDNISTMFTYMRGNELSFNANETFELYIDAYESFKEMLRSTFPKLIQELLKENIDQVEINPDDLQKQVEKTLMPFFSLTMGKACIDFYNEYMNKLSEEL